MLVRRRPQGVAGPTPKVGNKASAPAFASLRVGPISGVGSARVLGRLPESAVAPGLAATPISDQRVSCTCAEFPYVASATTT